MDFKEAIESLAAPVTHQRIADALGVSRATVRQAMLPEGARARRKAPPDWEGAVADLAETRAYELGKLTKELNRQAKASAK